MVCKIANKYLDFCERVEVIERHKDGPLPFPAVQWIVSACERKPW